DRFAQQPDVENALRQMVARTYHGLASWDKALHQWQSALELAERRSGSAGRDALWAKSQIAHIRFHQGRVDAETLELARSAASGLTTMLGPDHARGVASQANLAQLYAFAGQYDESIALNEALVMRSRSRLGPSHPDTMLGSNNLAVAYRYAGRLDEAIKLL